LIIILWPKLYVRTCFCVSGLLLLDTDMSDEPNLIALVEVSEKGSCLASSKFSTPHFKAENPYAHASSYATACIPQEKRWKKGEHHSLFLIKNQNQLLYRAVCWSLISSKLNFQLCLFIHRFCGLYANEHM
jgi:hypothetical protein